MRKYRTIVDDKWMLHCVVNRMHSPAGAGRSILTRMSESSARAKHLRSLATSPDAGAQATLGISRSARVASLALAVMLAFAAQSGFAQVRTPTSSSATPSPPSRGQALAAACTPCHQPGLTGIPTLSGQTREALQAKLHEFRDGSLAGTVMPQLARGYTAAELDALAQWFASRPTPP